MTGDKQLCQNCRHELTGEYCSNCGQRNVHLKLPLKDLLKDLLEEVLSFDSRLIHSLAPFVRKPGLLTVEFMSGRRTHHISPFKLYFFMSFLYFFTAAMVEDPTHKPQVNIKINDDSLMTGIRSDSALKLNTMGGLKLNVTKGDTGAVERKFGHRFAAGLRKVKENPQAFYDRLHEHTPQIVFLLLPVFALLLKLIYVRSKTFYIQHLVFSFFYHSFVYFVLFLIVLLNSAGLGAISSYADLLFFAIPVNLYMGMRRVYRQSRTKTFVKFVLLIGSYGCVLLAAVASTVFILISLL